MELLDQILFSLKSTLRLKILEETSLRPSLAHITQKFLWLHILGQYHPAWFSVGFCHIHVTFVGHWVSSGHCDWVIFSKKFILSHSTYNNDVRKQAVFMSPSDWSQIHKPCSRFAESWDPEIDNLISSPVILMCSHFQYYWLTPDYIPHREFANASWMNSFSACEEKACQICSWELHSVTLLASACSELHKVDNPRVSTLSIRCYICDIFSRGTQTAETPLRNQHWKILSKTVKRWTCPSGIS